MNRSVEHVCKVDCLSVCMGGWEDPLPMPSCMHSGCDVCSDECPTCAIGVGNDMEGVLVLGATNLPWALDAAIRRR